MLDAPLLLVRLGLFVLEWLSPVPWDGPGSRVIYRDLEVHPSPCVAKGCGPRAHAAHPGLVGAGKPGQATFDNVPLGAIPAYTPGREADRGMEGGRETLHGLMLPKPDEWPG